MDFWFLNSVSLVCKFHFMSVSYHFAYYNFVIHFEIWNGYAASSFVFLPQNHFQKPLWFHMNFRFIFSIFVQNVIQDFDSKCNESVGHFVQGGHFNNISLQSMNMGSLFIYLCLFNFLNVLSFLVSKYFTSLVQFIPILFFFY